MSVRKGQTSSAVTTSIGQPVSTVTAPCSPDDDSSCGLHEACRLAASTLYACQCIIGYTRNDASNQCTG